MITLLLSTVLLGVAGIDPLGAVIVASAITAGISRAKIVLFTACVFVFTILTGIFFSYAGTNFIANITSSLPDSDSAFWAFINIAIVMIIGVWLYRKSKPAANQKPRKKLTDSPWAIILAGVAFGVGAVFDPTFLAVISLAGQNGNLLTIATMHTIWVLISQVLLFGLFIAYLFGKHRVILERSKALWQRHKDLFNRLVFGAAVLSVTVLVVDTLFFIARGEYLIF